MSNNRPLQLSRYSGPGGISGGFAVQNVQRYQPTSSFRNLNIQPRIDVQSQSRQQSDQFLLNRQPIENEIQQIPQRRQRDFYKKIQPKTNIEIDSQLEFLQIELDRLNKIKQNIIRIGRKSDIEKQLQLHSKLKILLIQENFLASIYNKLTQVYENF